MSKWILALLLGSFFAGFHAIRHHNELVNAANAAFRMGDWQKVDSLLRPDSGKTLSPPMRLNRAHALFRQKDTNAIKRYQALSTSPDTLVKSVALQQLGYISAKKQPPKREEALAYCKSALYADWHNPEARYNYELLKHQKNQQDKKKDQKKKNQNKKNQKNENKKDQDKKNKKQDNKNQKNNQQKKNQGDKKKQNQKNKGQKKKNKEGDQQQKKDQKEKGQKGKGQNDKENQKGQQQQKQGKKGDKEKQPRPQSQQGKKGDKEKAAQRPRLDPEQLKKMKMSPEKAKAILDAMRSNEIKYLQQRQRKTNQKPPESDKPDW